MNINKLKTRIMKTKIKNQKMYVNGCTFFLIAVLMLTSASLFSQEQDSFKTLLKSDVKVTELFSPEVKLNSIQGDIGTLVGLYGGPLINRTLLIGACGGVNLGHPRVNYGYFGGIIQYTFNPEEMVHFSTQLVMAFGTAKDYENPKSSLFDNFWNISGTSFYMMEPGVNVEVNLNSRIIFVAGVSYRYVSGLNPNSNDVSLTHVTNGDMSGVNISIGLKFRKEVKNN